MSTFKGFADADAKFFKALAKKNERAWFTEHKRQYDEGYHAPMGLLLADVRAAIDRAYAHCDLGEPKVFRIFRDVRFSKDKSPYKTHIGGFIPIQRVGKRVTDLPMALYFHVGAKEAFAAAGHYMMQPDALARFRSAVAEEARGKELEKILRALTKKGFVAKSHETLKRVPKGYDEGHPRAELLKGKGLIVEFPKLPKGILASPKLGAWVVSGCKTAMPLVEWLAYATA
jgi:uncharacterized protein (TIGR02453 family)